MSLYVCAFFLLLGLFSPAAFAEKADVLTRQESSYPRFILNVMNRIPRWSPQLEADQTCQKSLSGHVLDESKCRSNYNLNFFDSYRSKLFFDFAADETNDFKKVDFHLDSGPVIRGLMGLHHNQKKPLVIFRMGVHGNRDEFLAERFLIRILYQDLGYHVLMLESLTSHGYIRSNEHISIGGLEEALQTIYVLNLIKEKQVDWSKDVESIHLMALSMGGAGAMLATYLDEATHQQIQSVQLFCPLINLRETFERMSEPGVKNALIDFWNSRRMKELKHKFKALEDLSLWPMILDLKPRFALEILNQFNQNNIVSVIKPKDFEDRFKNFHFPAKFLEHYNHSRTFYDVNNYWKIFENKKTPIQIVYTPNDPLVFNDLNVGQIMSGKQEGVFEKISYLELQGTHCALAEEYQWPFLVELVKRQIQISR